MCYPSDLDSLVIRGRETTGAVTYLYLENPHQLFYTTCAVLNMPFSKATCLERPNINTNIIIISTRVLLKRLGYLLWDLFQGLKITMTKHPSCFRLESPLKEKNEQVTSGPAVTLFEGSVRNLCPLAPNNVNTMAAAAIAAHNLGFDKVQGCIVADPK